MRLVFLSDTHGHYRSLNLPAGDVLVHGGDFGARGDLNDLAQFASWIRELPFRHKLFVSGNNDPCFLSSPQEALEVLEGVQWLRDCSIEIEGVHFYGATWQSLLSRTPLSYERERSARAVLWSRIPSNTDVLITHVPPHGILDRNRRGRNQGCSALRTRVDEIAPRVHLFGHIHECRGHTLEGQTLFVNGAVCDTNYQPQNPPMLVELANRETRRIEIA